MQDAPHRPVKIGEAAAATGLTESALRFYEKEGLLVPARTSAGTRLYYPRHLRRARMIRELVEAGLPLSLIRAITRARRPGMTGDEGAAALAPLIGRALAGVRERRARLQWLEQNMKAALSLVEGCRGCANEASSRHCPDCPVNRHRESVPFVELFWE